MRQGIMCVTRAWQRLSTTVLALWFLAGCLAPGAWPSELNQETAAAFDRYVRAAEARMTEDIERQEFLIVDQLSDARRRIVEDRLQHGGLYIEELRTLEGGHPIPVPSGLIHHWAGVSFIPGATLSETLAVLRDYDHHKDIYRPDVRESKLLEQKGNEFKIHLQFYKKSLVTVVLNADFDVTYTQFGKARLQSASHSTRIAEVEDAGKPDEHEYPVGKDHGYLWRLNSYWRIEEKDGGVYVQNESIALTRTVPAIIAWLVNPLLKSIPRSSISRLLMGTHDAVLKEKNSSAAS